MIGKMIGFVSQFELLYILPRLTGQTDLIPLSLKHVRRILRFLDVIRLRFVSSASGLSHCCLNTSSLVEDYLVDGRDDLIRCSSFYLILVNGGLLCLRLNEISIAFVVPGCMDLISRGVRITVFLSCSVV
jgi:hypothetical protein